MELHALTLAAHSYALLFPLKAWAQSIVVLLVYETWYWAKIRPAQWMTVHRILGLQEDVRSLSLYKLVSLPISFVLLSYSSRLLSLTLFPLLPLPPLLRFFP